MNITTLKDAVPVQDGDDYYHLSDVHNTVHFVAYCGEVLPVSQEVFDVGGLELCEDCGRLEQHRKWRTP